MPKENIHPMNAPNMCSPESLSIRDSRTRQPENNTSCLPVLTKRIGQDGTRKLLLGLSDGNTVECVCMAMPATWTVCLSTQIGCPIGCVFCRTGQSGFVRNLSWQELLWQFNSAASEIREVSGKNPERVVLMGMGEPLLNPKALHDVLSHLTQYARPAISWRKILCSTVGIPAELDRLSRLRLALPAISLHAPTQTLRDKLMPGAKRWPLSELMAVLRSYPLPGRERMIIEYVMLDTINDTDEHARMLEALIGPIRAKINLIPCNPVPGSPYHPSSPDRIDGFAQRLRSFGRTVFVRRSLGPDIFAACGQLRAEHTT